MQTITIDNLKSIKHLDFQIPEKPGVYLLVGTNGAGKSTLLTCLWRIGDSEAFKKNFKAGTASGMDTYSESNICYKINGKEKSFKKGPKRWCPTPRKNTEAFFKQFGFEAVVFIDANRDRISPTQDEIDESGPLSDASRSLISQMNKAFSTNRFSNLKQLKNKNGRRWFRYYYAIKNPESGETYTEKQFSSGELAALRVFGNLRELDEGSLVLIDEGELALHPAAQVELLHYLQELADLKQSTVIVSTHSSVMISLADDEHIIALEKTAEEETKVIHPCSAARALRGICPPEIVLAINDLITAAETEIANEQTQNKIKAITSNIKEEAASARPRPKILKGLADKLETITKGTTIAVNATEFVTFLMNFFS